MVSIESLISDEKVRSILDAFDAGWVDALVDLTIQIQQIPAPSFDEFERAKFVHSFFKTIGLLDVSTDEIGNVYGRWQGTGEGLPIVVSAHTDTVFAKETDLTTKRENGKVSGPGIADNSAGVAGLLTLAMTFVTHQLQTERDIWFVANVCEEGLGNLNGMREVVSRFGETAGYIVLEGGMYGFVLHEAIGVKRYKITAESKGGHSWSDFGTPSAVHTLARVIAEIDQIPLTKSPKSTINVGVIEGGTTINAIASQASALVDTRSENNEKLGFIRDRIDEIVQRIGAEEGITITKEVVGSRPSGQIHRNTGLVRSAEQALITSGHKIPRFLRGSTDANIPLSHGYPAVCIGLTKSENAHRLDEYLETKHLPKGMTQLLLLTLSASGFQTN